MYYFLLFPVAFYLLYYNIINEFVKYKSIYIYPTNPISITQINKESIPHIIEKINYSKDDTITFLINSNGGDVMQGYKLIQNMEILKKMDITFDCYAIKAASMAFDIFQHCDNRYVIPNTYLMQHSATLIANWTMEELQYLLASDYFNELIRINNELDKFSAEKLNMRYENYKDLIAKDLVLNSGEDILDLNCADEIVKIVDINFLEL
jgi:ATP-dependent protease ClpP protease subunit